MSSKQEVEEFFSEKKILILDSSKATRELVKNILMDFNVKQKDILSTESYPKALKYILTERPTIVFTDIEIDKRSGLQLLQNVSEYVPCTNKRLFYVITANNDEVAVAEAAEEDVDNYLLKPFSKEIFVKYIYHSVEEKLRPSKYLVTIEEGKLSLSERDLDNALELFQKAKELNNTPSLACYYVGEAQRLKKNSLNALLEFEEGLSINSIHYRCLVGKFETLDELQQSEEAYEVVKTLTKFFPVSPQRLGKIFKLAVFTQNFSDAKKFYELFEKIEYKSEELRKIVSAALKVSGKFLINHEDKPGALEAFKNAIVTSKLDINVITNIVEFLIEHKMAEDAESMLELFPVSERQSEKFLQLDFSVLYHQGNVSDALKVGYQLITDNAATADIFEGVAKILVHEKRNTAAESVLYQGIEAYPDHREDFSKLLDDLNTKK